MIDASGNPSLCFGRRSQKLIRGVFLAILSAAVVLTLMILLLPTPAFLALSNYLQIAAAICAAIVFFFGWLRCPKSEALLWAAAGFLLWGIANIVWYIMVILGMRSQVFPGIIDIAMAGSFLVLAVAFRKSKKGSDIPKALPVAILALCIIIPLIIIGSTAISIATIAILAYFIACGTFLATGVMHTGRRSPVLLTGASLYALAFFIYPIREAFLITNPMLPVIGTFISAGFALMVIGWVGTLPPAA